MDKEAFEKFENEKKEIHKRYKKLHRNVWLGWIGFSAASVVILFVLKKFAFPDSEKLMPFFITLGLVLVLFSLYIALKKHAEWNKQESREMTEHEESAPTGRFKFGE